MLEDPASSGPSTPALTPRAILEAVAEEHAGVTVAAILGPSRKRAIVRARHEVCARLYNETGMTQIEVGVFLGLDPTTVSYAISKVNGPDLVGTLVAQSRALVDAIQMDDAGMMVGPVWMGGNGGLLSPTTIAQADKVRLALVEFERSEGEPA